ncbi:hypothetical protein FD755_010243 [Muntiacus reevesi]|uniref:Uncharacterized protein n=1 Tax=Muntiacus reevesi TaxID=9886 RepID=A0A5N3XZ21_MUNRE|nr:hypothetical protein FD755_010243 [Muntiacus reevesi]
MGDAERCLLRQQTREVRKKPLINYCFLRAAASAELWVLAAARLAGQRRAPRTASSEAEPRREGTRSADPAGQRSRRRAVPRVSAVLRSGRWRCVLGRAILVTARALPAPGLPQDQPQRLGRQPWPPFPAWGNKSAQ